MSAPGYFAESISSDLGFWGVRCKNYFDFLVGRCGDLELDDQEEEDTEEESLFKTALKRMDGLPQEDATRIEPVRLQWQLMGEHCNKRWAFVFCLPVLSLFNGVGD